MRLQTATSATNGTVSGMKVVTTPSMPTVATTVRIQSPLPTSATIADSSNISTGTVPLVPSSNTAVTSTIRLSTPIRQTLVKTMPVKMPSATVSTAIRTPNVNALTPKSVTSSINTKNNFVSKSPMLAGIGKQQIISSQSKNTSKERDRKSTLASTGSSTASVTALAGGYV